MSQDEKNQSEIARLRAQIQAESESAYQGLHGLSQGSAKHEFITARMERIGELHEELKKIDEHADKFLIQTLEDGRRESDAKRETK
jgi:hypothetical protein